MADRFGRVVGTERRSFFEAMEQQALWIGLIAALIQAVVSFFFNPGGGLPLVGSPDSLAVRSMYSTVLIALLVSPYAYIRGMQARNRLVPDEFKQDYRWSVAPMTVAAVLVLGVMIALVFAVLERSFAGTQFNRFSLTLFLSTVTGAVGYVTASLMSRLRASGMLYLVLAALFGTLLFAGARNEDPYWWQNSFSHLGMTASNSKTILNIGLVVTGAMIIIWQQFFMTEVRALERRNLISSRTCRIFSGILILAGALLAIVGLVPFGISFFHNVVHNLSAMGAGAALGVLMAAMWWLNPHYVRVFYYVSALMVLVMVVAIPVHFIGFIGLVGLQFAGFVLAGFWLILFLRNTGQLIEDAAPEARI